MPAPTQSATTRSIPGQSTIEAVLDYADANLAASRANLFDLLRIKSISAQPAHAADCVQGGRVVARSVERPGFRGRCPSDRRPSGSRRPFRRAGGYAGPHILFYGHYDVQPVDPVSLWHSDPFDPQYVDGPRGKRYVARGAVDDKGQTMMFLEALRAWHDRRRRHSRPHHRADRGRGRGRFGQPRPVPARQQSRTCRRHRADQRHRHVGRRHPGHHHPPARHDLCRGDAESRQPRPAFRPVWRVGAESDQRADEDPGRVAGRERPHPVAWLLRQGVAGQ